MEVGLEQLPLALVLAAEVDGVDQAVAVGVFGCQVIETWGVMERASTVVGVPEAVATLASPVSVTVTLYGALAACEAAGLAPAPAAAVWVVTLMLFTTGGVFCGR